MKKWLGIIIASALLTGCSVGGGFGVGNGGAGVSVGTGIGF